MHVKTFFTFSGVTVELDFFSVSRVEVSLTVFLGLCRKLLQSGKIFTWTVHSRLYFVFSTCCSCSLCSYLTDLLQQYRNIVVSLLCGFSYELTSQMFRLEDLYRSDTCKVSLWRNTVSHSWGQILEWECKSSDLPLFSDVFPQMLRAPSLLGRLQMKGSDSWQLPLFHYWVVSQSEGAASSVTVNSIFSSLICRNNWSWLCCSFMSGLCSWEQRGGGGISSETKASVKHERRFTDSKILGLNQTLEYKYTTFLLWASFLSVVLQFLTGSSHWGDWFLK